MKLFKHWLLMIMAVSCITASVASADCCCGNPTIGELCPADLDERDYDAIIDYVNSKRTIDLQEKVCNMAISGDIRASWAHIKNRVNDIKRRGKGSTDCSGDEAPINPIAGTFNGQRVPTDEFDVELNLNFDYKCDRSWGVAQVRFRNPMGVQESSKYSTGQLTNNEDQQWFSNSSCARVDNNAPFGSGRCDGLCLRRAYMGYNVCCDGCSRFDIEVGRRRFYDVFDSRVEFNCLFDGLLFRYATHLGCESDAYVNFAGFVVDYRSEHFGWVVETGWLNICDSGWDAKYSYIDWLKKGTNRAGQSHPKGWQFQVSQWLAYYHFDDDLLSMPTKVYGAFLWNSAARKVVQTKNKKDNMGWYIGATVGEVCREGDWAIDVNYQYIQAQCIPDPDVSGIGRDNILGETLYQGVDPNNARGNGNYKGWKVEGLYAVTDNLSIDASFVYSRACESQVGGKLNYTRWKLEAIYAF